MGFLKHLSERHGPMPTLKFKDDGAVVFGIVTIGHIVKVSYTKNTNYFEFDSKVKSYVPSFTANYIGEVQDLITNHFNTVPITLKFNK